MPRYSGSRLALVETSLPVADRPRRPEWMKVRAPSQNGSYFDVKKLLHGQRLNTICEEARCPNIAECWGRGTATFQILGDTCTRACRYCYVHSGKPSDPVDPLEPLRLAQAAAQMNLKHVVVTSVDRDDVADKGAGHYAATIRAIRAKLPESKIEVLTPDFLGVEEAALQTVIGARPDVFNHNIETVRRLHRAMRGGKASYDGALRPPQTGQGDRRLPGADEERHHRGARGDERRGRRDHARPALPRRSTSSRSASTCSRARSTPRSTAGCTPTSSAGSASRARRSASGRSSPGRSCVRATAPTSSATLPRPAAAQSPTSPRRLDITGLRSADIGLYSRRWPGRACTASCCACRKSSESVWSKLLGPRNEVSTVKSSAASKTASRCRPPASQEKGSRGCPQRDP